MEMVIVNGVRIGGTMDPTLHEMLTAHIDEAGKRYEVGTRYHTLCSGEDNISGACYQSVTIAGRAVTFRGRTGK